MTTQDTQDTKVQAPIIPNNPKDQEAILAALKEMDEAMIQIAAHQDHMKSIVDRVKEKYGVKKNLFKWMAKTYHKQNFVQVETETEEKSIAYQTIVKTAAKS